MSHSENPHFLLMQEYHLSEAKARQEVIRELQACGQQEPASGWKSFELTWNDSPSEPVKFSELVAEARKNGIVARLQRYLDQTDAIFGGMIDDMMTPNWQLTISREWAGFKGEAQGPCRAGFSERDLIEDILYYRSEACARSNEYDFRATCRYFRAYLFACVSVVDAFINRHILLAHHEGFTSPEFERLKESTKPEERIRLWFVVCSTDDPGPFFESKEWCHFQEIRSKRNEVIHSVVPIGMYALREIQEYLNKVRSGVGGLLAKMRSAHGKPVLGFIQQLCTAPLVDFHQITFRAEGQHRIKRIQGL
jgi:hypothetical protein